VIASALDEAAWMPPRACRAACKPIDDNPERRYRIKVAGVLFTRAPPSPPRAGRN